jgi:hypothetical protein
VIARAIGDALAVLQIRPDRRVLLQALELVEGREPRVLVVQVHDQPDRHVVIAEMVHEAATAGVVLQRPEEGVLHEARLEHLVGHLPDLLQPDAELLRLAAFGEAEPGLQHLGQRPAHPLGNEGVFGVQF